MHKMFIRDLPGRERSKRAITGARPRHVHVTLLGNVHEHVLVTGVRVKLADPSVVVPRATPLLHGSGAAYPSDDLGDPNVVGISWSSKALATFMEN